MPFPALSRFALRDATDPPNLDPPEDAPEPPCEWHETPEAEALLDALACAMPKQGGPAEALSDALTAVLDGYQNHGARYYDRGVERELWRAGRAAAERDHKAYSARWRGARERERAEACPDA